MSNQAEDLQSDQEDKPTKLGVWRESLGLEAPMRWSQKPVCESANFLFAACLCVFTSREGTEVATVRMEFGGQVSKLQLFFELNHQP